MKKLLYVYGGPEFHPTREAGKVLEDVLKSDGRFELEMTRDLDAFTGLSEGKFDVVVLYTTGFIDELTAEREKGLLEFVKNGGGFVGIHSAADSFRGNRRYIEMLGNEFLYHPEIHEYTVSVVNKEHYITTRLEDYAITDEMYHLQNYDPAKVTLLAETPWKGKKMPLAYVKNYGEGRVAYLANGHDLRAWRNHAFQKLVVRSIAWVAGAEKPVRKLRCGLLGYGTTCSMGKGHGSWINSTEGMETVAMCDRSPERVEVAKNEFPGLKGYFTDLDDMLAMEGLDLVVIILPHNQHTPAAIKCLEAGKYVVLEKPFCINVNEADN
ncbi:MAG: ThuA domain-containing protein, partial [Clostridiales bacterium]|nr:ThuA domain-containing protein [Clostridiales bacterium]